MGEKGNVADMGEDIFKTLAEQSPQFWFDYENYKLARARGAEGQTAAEEQTVAGQRITAEDPTGKRPTNPATK
jgi:hypothetical protein